MCALGCGTQKLSGSVFVRRSAEKIAFDFLEVRVQKENYKANEYGNADSRGKSHTTSFALRVAHMSGVVGIKNQRRTFASVPVRVY